MGPGTYLLDTEELPQWTSCTLSLYYQRSFWHLSNTKSGFLRKRLHAWKQIWRCTPTASLGPSNRYTGSVCDYESLDRVWQHQCAARCRPQVEPYNPGPTLVEHHLLNIRPLNFRNQFFNLTSDNINFFYQAGRWQHWPEDRQEFRHYPLLNRHKTKNSIFIVTSPFLTNLHKVDQIQEESEAVLKRYASATWFSCSGKINGKAGRGQSCREYQNTKK